jgi:GNAT superfamily N-acetyltransferase
MQLMIILAVAVRRRPRMSMSEVAAFLYPTSEEALFQVYTVDRSQVGPALSTLDNRLTRFRLDIIKNAPSDEKLKYLVTLYAPANEPILDKDLERWLWDNKQLCGRPTQRARVAFRVNFFIRRKFQRAGLATYLCGKEEGFFQSWGAKEIQVVAMEMGRWVWTRAHFGYQIPKFDFESAQQKYKEWQRARGISPVARAVGLSDFPRDFLLGDEIGSLTLYKTL